MAGDVLTRWQAAAGRCARQRQWVGVCGAAQRGAASCVARPTEQVVVMSYIERDMV